MPRWRGDRHRRQCWSSRRSPRRSCAWRGVPRRPGCRAGGEVRRRRVPCADEVELMLALERALLGTAYEFTFAREA